MKDLTIAIAGNPNCGKSTLFNGLTGARQKVGNWPGVTVDRLEGRYRDQDLSVCVVDLPGVYTLGALPGSESLDEKLARDFIHSGEADIIIDIVDAGNLERNLYLTAQLLEMGVPMIVALNMMDTAKKDGIEVDAAALSDRLGCPVVPMAAARGAGIEELKGRIREIAETRAVPTQSVDYGHAVEKAISRLEPVFSGPADADGTPARWLVARLLEGDDLALSLIDGTGRDELAAVTKELEAELGEDVDILIADGRFTFANRIAGLAAQRTGEVRRKTSDVIDKVVLNGWAGPIIFIGLMYLMFMFTINLGGAFIDVFDLAAAAVFVDGLGTVMTAIGLPDWTRVVVADGIGGGIQVVATFIPIIGFLYLFLSLLEDSGYMARAAFLMDRLMRAVGLPGKSFVPLIVGFGCNVPAIMATRTLEQERDRIMTVMMAPFMSCGARLAVYALFAAAFFPVGGQNIVFALYFIGIAVAMATGLILRFTVLRGETNPFIMELPAYHIPRPRDVLINAWTRLKSFLFGAGKIIVVVVAVLSVLNSIGTDGSFGNEDSDKSVLSAIGRSIVPVFTPMGITEDNWPATVGIFTGIFAKEAVVGTLDALYSSIDAQNDNGNGNGGEETSGDEAFSLTAALSEAVATIPENLSSLRDLVADPLGFSIVQSDGLDQAAADQEVSLATFGSMQQRFDGTAGAMAYLLFILLYVPCVAALGAVNRETGPRWTTFAALWTTGVAFYVSISVYQLARLGDHPMTSIAWVAGLNLVLAVFIYAMRLKGRHEPTAVPAEAG